MTRGPWTKFGRSVCVGFKSDKSHCRVVQMDDRLPGSRILQIIFSSKISLIGKSQSIDQTSQ